MNRKIGVLILATIAVLCLAFAACTPSTGVSMTKAEALQNYIFENEGQIVKEDFVLPKRIGNYRTTWTSDNENVVIEKGEDSYIAKVTIPEEDQTVTLTVDLYGITKDYTVRLAAITTYDIMGAFSFAQNRATVYEDFELPTEATYKGKTAAIEWSVEDEASKANISIEGNVCKVIPSSLNPTVKLNATFTYKGKTAPTFYTFTVSEKMEHLQEVNYWYTNTGVSITMKGYVIAIATAWSSTYNNVNIYMMDENFDAGYYLYRVGCDAANAENLKPGAYVTVEGTTNTVYNGLYETNAGGTLTVDTTKEAIDVQQYVYALDNDVLAGAPAANYNQSRLVSLTNWKVASVSKVPSSGSNGTLFTLEKGGKKVAVSVSKYFEGIYAANETDPAWKGLIDKQAEIKAKLDAGEEVYVSVKGILGNYKGAQVMPYSAADVVYGTAVENDTLVGTTVGKAIAQVNKQFTDLPKLITANTTLDLASEIEGVQVSYKTLGIRNSFGIADGQLVIVPAAAEVATIQATFTYEGYTANTFYVMQAENLDDLGKAKWEVENLKVMTEVLASGEYDLPSTAFFDNAKIVWTTDAAYASISGLKLNVSLPLEASKMVLVATVTVGAESYSREYFVAVSAMNAEVPTYLETMAAGTYKMGLYQGNIGKTLYLAGTISNDFLVTTTESEKAATVVVEATETGYTLKLNGKYIEVHKNSAGSVRANLVENASASWTVKDNGALVFAFENGEYFLNAYGTYETVGVSKVSYYTADGSNGTYAAKFITGVRTMTAQDILDNILGLMSKKVDSDFALDSKATWELVEGSQGIELDGLTAKVTQADAEQTATLKATVTYNGETVSKDFVVTVPALVLSYETKTLAEFIELPDSNEAFYQIAGFVTEIQNTTYGNVVISDGITEILVYGLCSEKMELNDAGKFNNLKDFANLNIQVGDYVVLLSAKGSYKGSAQALGSGLLEKYSPKTLTEFMALEDSNEAFYIIEGDVTEIQNTTYGNVVISDGTTEMLVYGLCAQKMELNDAGKFNNLKDFNTLGIEVGSHVVLISAKGSYKGSAQALGSGLLQLTAGGTCDHTWDEGVVTTPATCTVNGVMTYTCTKCGETKTEDIIAPGHVDENADGVCDVCGENLNTTPDEYETKTLAQFLALEDNNEVFYKIEGVVTEIINTTYGNFYITDGTTIVYVYGLCAQKMELNDAGKFNNLKDFNTLGIEVGMHVVLVSAKSTYSGAAQAVGSGLISKGEASDLEKIYVAKASIKVAESVNGNFTLPTYEGVTITWTSDNTAIAINGTEATVTQTSSAQTVKLTATFTCNTATQTVEYTVNVAAKVEGSQTLTYNFVGAQSNWGPSYVEHSTTINGTTVVFSRANEQQAGNTIDDRPVLATGKGTTDAYVTIDMGSVAISSVTFNLMQWATKTFSSITVEYYDGSAWVKCATLATLSGACSVTGNFTTATQVRLHVNNSSKSNVQLGITSAVVTTVA